MGERLKRQLDQAVATAEKTKSDAVASGSSVQVAEASAESEIAAIKRVLVKWKGGGHDCFAPGTIMSFVGNDMEVKYDLEVGARVQKVDLIDVATGEHRRMVVGSNNPSSRRVTAWVLESHAQHGVLTADGAVEKPEVVAEEEEEEESSNDSGSDSSSDSEGDKPLSQRRPAMKRKGAVLSEQVPANKYKRAAARDAIKKIESLDDAESDNSESD